MCRTPPLAVDAASSSTRRFAHSSARVFWCRAFTGSSYSSTNYRTTPKPETRIACQVVEEEAALWRENRNRAPAKKIKRHSHHHPPHDSKQRNYWMKLVRVCRLDVVAAAAACCSYCDEENSPPPNEARAIRREGRRAISTQLSRRVVRTCQSCII